MGKTAAAPEKKRCVGCRVEKAAGLKFKWYAGPRCKTCHRPTERGQPGKEWQACHDCSEEGPCTRPEQSWLCRRCVARRARADAGAGLGAGLDTLSAGCTADQRSELLARHLVLARVDIWVMPCSAECLIVLARIVFWRLHGRFAGLLPGPPPGVLSRGGGRRGRTCNVALMAAFIVALHEEARLPPGDAPLLLTGVNNAQLAAVRAALPAAVATGRFRAYPESLSRRVSASGWTLQAFLDHPDENGGVLGTRVRGALAAAGLQSCGARSLTTPDGLAVCRSLHVR